MHIHGSFYNKQEQRITVDIVTHGDTTQQLEIGSEESGIYFTDDPVEITSQVNDTFDVLLCSQASVRLLCRDFVPDFFCSSCREAVVSIFVDNRCLFAGFIEPQAFSQDYNEALDEVELTCIDRLAALQYSNYRSIGASGVSYALVKSRAEQRTFLDIITELLASVTGCTEDDVLDLIHYDGSKSLDGSTGNARYQVMQNISISELLFLGDEEDDVWTGEDVLTEMLKYLGLHIAQVGEVFYVFSWESILKGGTIPFRILSDTSTANASEASQLFTLNNGMVADCETQLNVCPTYNQLLLTDNVTEIDNVIESPLDSNSLMVAGNYQKYMTEYISDGEGTRSYNGMKAMVTGSNDYSYDGASTVDWYIWPKSVRNWKFYGGGDHKTDIYSKYPADGTHQQDILNEGMTAGIGACVCAFGKIERKQNLKDNSPITSVSMDDYLVVSLMGDDRDGMQKPTDTAILAACPVAEYTGNVSGGSFSPSDNDTINYIVISGKMALSPTMDETSNYAKMSKAANWYVMRSGIPLPNFTKTVDQRNGRNMRYTRQYWKADSWRDEAVSDGTEKDTDRPNAKDYHETFYPLSDIVPQNYEYKYSAVDTETDNIKKLGLIACMLIIGDKCVVEKMKGEDLGTGVPGTGEGEPEDYVWITYRERSKCQSDEEYYQQSFTIGIDPKIGDKVLGSEFDIQKNAPYTRGITAEGTAIPIRMDDHVSGKVRFVILGPVNAEWNNITRRHPSFWRHTKWYQDSVLLLQKTNAIFLKDFKVEVVSDNGKMGAVGDNKDIVYMSDTREDFVNKKDDLEFKITTALTSEECRAMGVNNAVKLSSPENVRQRNALLDIYDWNKRMTAKPEKLYVDSYWQEWHEPRVELTQNLIDSDSYVSPFSRFHVPSIGKNFFVEGISRNLTEGTAQVTMKEIF